MHIKTIPVLADNYCYLIVEHDMALCIDPGEAAPVIDVLDAEGLTLDQILITHSHHDHIGGIKALRAYTPCPLTAPRDLSGSAPTTQLEDRLEITFGKRRLCALATPGHCQQHFAFYTENMIFSGDVLFAGGCGRILGGTPQALWTSLQRLAALPDDTDVYCGHNYTVDSLRFGLSILPDDPDITQALETAQRQDQQGEASVPTSIGSEKRSNIFLRSDDPEVAAAVQREGASACDVFTELRRRKNSW